METKQDFEKIVGILRTAMKLHGDMDFSEFESMCKSMERRHPDLVKSFTELMAKDKTFVQTSFKAIIAEFRQDSKLASPLHFDRKLEGGSRL
jgi:hypothetical protein